VTGRQVMGVAAVLGALGVALGAFGAHGLRERLGPEDLATLETGARYQLYHALALLGVGAWLDRLPGGKLVWAARLFVFGSVVFAGSLYLLVLTSARWLGAITPFGGVALIGGWVLIALAAADRRPL